MNRRLEQFSFVKVNFNRTMCGTSHGTAVTHRNDRIYGRIIKLAAVFVSDKPTEKTRFGLWKKNIYIADQPPINCPVSSQRNRESP